MSASPVIGTARAPARHAAGSTRPPEPVLGEWKLLKLIGQGRWTRIFQARPAGLQAGNGDYAIKVLVAIGADETMGRAVLRREAGVLRHVQHPRLVSILADRSAEGISYLVLPYLAGTNLRQDMAARGNRLMPLATALWIARQIAEALAALHLAGWLHGDVKPENVLVSARGEATLLDLGLARRLLSDECRADQVLAGTVAYAAPESFRECGLLTAASDVYSLGVLLYELLTGQRPFTGTDPAELVRQHRMIAPPSLRQSRPGLAMEIEQLVRQMLSKEPLRRPSAAELVRRLAELEIMELTLV